jgi:hypothetical protein
MAKKYYTPNPSVKRNKKGKIISETVKAIANQDQFLSFNDVNRLYKKLATQHNTKNISVVVRNGQGRFSSLKAHGNNVDDLTMDDTDYYQKYDRDNRQKFNNFVQVDFVIHNK